MSEFASLVESSNLGRGKSGKFLPIRDETQAQQNNRDVTPSRLEHNNYRLRFFEHDVSEVVWEGCVVGKGRRWGTEGNRAQGWKVENVTGGASVSCAYTQ